MADHAFDKFARCIDDYVCWKEEAPEFALSLLHVDVSLVN